MFATLFTSLDGSGSVNFEIFRQAESESKLLQDLALKFGYDGLHMRNYLFTLISPSRSEQLDRESQFPDSEHAFCLAELIASELSIDETGKWRGWTIEVRDCKGTMVFSVPVGHSDALPHDKWRSCRESVKVVITQHPEA